MSSEQEKDKQNRRDTAKIIELCYVPKELDFAI